MATQDIHDISGVSGTASGTPRSPVLAITGATGFVGGHCLRMALAMGWHVRALTRRKPPTPDPTDSPNSPNSPAGNVQWIEGTLADAAALAALVQGSDCVLHIAGMVKAHRRRDFAEANVEGTSAIVAACQQAGVERFVHISSLAARLPALSDYGWSKAKAEALVQASGLDWTMVRPPHIFGPGDVTFLSNYRLIKRGFALIPATEPEGRISVIMVTELCRLILALAQDREISLEKIYEPDDGRAGGWTHSDYIHAIGDVLATKRIREVKVAAPLIAALARILRIIPFVDSELTIDKARFIVHPDWTVASEMSPPELLWSPLQSTENALAETIAWYRERNLL